MTHPKSDVRLGSPHTSRGVHELLVCSAISYPLALTTSPSEPHHAALFLGWEAVEMNTAHDRLGHSLLSANIESLFPYIL